MAAKGKRGGLILILVALILILLVGAVYVYFQMQGAQNAQPVATPEPAKKMVDIVITTQFVPRGAELTEGTLMMIQYPEENLVQGTFITDMNSVLGSRAKYDLDPGIPLTQALLIQPTGGSVASFDVPADFVAIPIPVTRLTSVANALAPGDHVMVIGCMQLVDIDPEFQTKLPNNSSVVTAPGLSLEGGPPTVSSEIVSGGDPSALGRTEIDPTLNETIYAVPAEEQRPRIVCQTVIQDAVVLRVGVYEEPIVTAPVVQEQQDQNQDQAPTPTPIPTDEAKLMTLVVSPQDAVALNYMLLSGVQLNLALRNPSDTNPIVTDAVTQQYLMDQKNVPLPAKLPYGLERFLKPEDLNNLIDQLKAEPPSTVDQQ